MEKIKTILVHNDSEVIENIKINIKNLDKVEVIATATNGKDALNKIINLKPDIVFTKFELEDMNGMDLLEKTSKKLYYETPKFKYISSKLTLKTDNKEYDVDVDDEDEIEDSFVFVKELGIEEIITTLKHYDKPKISKDKVINMFNYTN